MRVRDVYARGSTAQMDWVIFMPSRRDGGEGGARTRGRARARDGERVGASSRARRDRGIDRTHLVAPSEGVCVRVTIGRWSPVESLRFSALGVRDCGWISRRD